MSTINLNKLAAFDLETTGVDVTQDRAVTAVIVKSDLEAGTEQEHSWLINPERPSNPKAAEVHGISEEKIKAEGQDIAQSTREIVEVLADAWAEGYTVVAYNANFDISMLIQQALDYGVELPEIGPILDPLIIDRGVDKYRRGPRKLLNVAAHYGVEFSDNDAHDAGNDARATLQVMRAMATAPKFAHNDFADLIGTAGKGEQAVQAQQEWAEEQERGFAEWQHREPQLGWPVKDTVAKQL